MARTASVLLTIVEQYWEPVCTISTQHHSVPVDDDCFYSPTPNPEGVTGPIPGGSSRSGFSELAAPRAGGIPGLQSGGTQGVLVCPNPLTLKYMYICIHTHIYMYTYICMYKHVYMDT